MPESSSPAHWGIPPVGDGDLEALLAPEPGEVAAGLRPVAEVLSALRAAPAPGELSGQELAMVTFREAAGQVRPRAQAAAAAGQRRTVAFRAPRHRRRPSGLMLAPRLAAAAALVVVALGGVAAYTGKLPAAIQSLAHDVIAAPPAHHMARHHPSPQPLARQAAPPTAQPAPSQGSSAGPAGDISPSVPAGSSPRASKHDFAGLCRALQRGQWPGQDGQNWDAIRALAEAAGGVWRVPAYCSAVTGRDTWPWDHQPRQHGQGQGSYQWPVPGGYPSAPAGLGANRQGANGQVSAIKNA